MSVQRAKFIKESDIKKIAAVAWDALVLASTHDPDHEKQLRRLESLIYAEVKFQDRRFRDLERRVSVLERQMERIGAPQYRALCKGKIRPRVPGKSAR